MIAHLVSQRFNYLKLKATVEEERTLCQLVSPLSYSYDGLWFALRKHMHSSNKTIVITGPSAAISASDRANSEIKQCCLFILGHFT